MTGLVESTLLEVVRVLSETYTDAGIAIWLTSPNRGLVGKVPLQCVKDGMGGDVLFIARSIEGGW